MGLVYCLNTSTIQPASLEVKIRAAAEAGFQAVELWFADIRAYQNAGGNLDTIVKLLEETGLSVPSMIALHGWMDAYGDAYMRAMDECRDLLRLAGQLGARAVVASPSVRMETRPLDIEDTAKRFQALMEEGRKVGVLPMMEFLGFTTKVYRVDHAWEIVKRTQDKEARIVLDPFHLWRGGSRLEDVPDLTGDRIGILHFNDVPATARREESGDEVRVMPGDGHLPLKELVEEVVRRGYQGPISVELFHRDYWKEDPFAVAKIAFEKTRRIVGG